VESSTPIARIETRSGKNVHKGQDESSRGGTGRVKFELPWDLRRSESMMRQDQDLSRPDVAEIQELVGNSLAAILEGQQDVSPEDIGLGTALIGPEALVDSIGLVTVIVEVEDRLQMEHGISVTIADEKAMSEARSPFLTVGSLVEYVHALVHA
jgi:acyl carrier protein